MARPRTLPERAVVIKVNVPADYDAALKTLATVTGEAKSSHLRRAIAGYLAQYGLGSPESATPVITSPTQPKENTP